MVYPKPSRKWLSIRMIRCVFGALADGTKDGECVCAADPVEKHWPFHGVEKMPREDVN